MGSSTSRNYTREKMITRASNNIYFTTKSCIKSVHSTYHKKMDNI